MAYATVADLETRWRPLSDAEKARAGVLLADAELRINVACPPSDMPTPSEQDARKVVCCEMVKRAMAAGTGPAVTQESQTRGPFTGQWSYANPTGDLYLTKQDKALLGCGQQRAGNVSLLGRDDG